MKNILMLLAVFCSSLSCTSKKEVEDRYLSHEERVKIETTDVPIKEGRTKVGDVDVKYWYGYETDQYEKHTTISEYYGFASSYKTPDVMFISEKIYPLKYQIDAIRKDTAIKSRILYDLNPTKFRVNNGEWYRGMSFVSSHLDSAETVDSKTLELELSTMTEKDGNYVVEVLQPPMPKVLDANSADDDSFKLTKVSVKDCDCLLITTFFGRATVSKDFKVVGFKWDKIDDCCIKALGFKSRDDWQKQQFKVIENLFRSLNQYGVLDPKNKNLLLGN